MKDDSGTSLARWRSLAGEPHFSGQIGSEMLHLAFSPLAADLAAIFFYHFSGGTIFFGEKILREGIVRLSPLKLWKQSEQKSHAVRKRKKR